MQIELSLSAETIANAAIATANASSRHIARVERVFEAMRKIVYAPDARIQHYRQDFDKYDRDYLERTRALGTYGWVVRESGTHLVQLGVHPKMNEELDAALWVGPSRDCYLIDARAGTVSPVNEARLREEMAQFTYVTASGVVSKMGRAIARIDVGMTSWAFASPPKGVVAYESVGVPIGLQDLIALSQIGASEVIRKSQSLFTGIESIKLDGADIFEMVEQRAD